MFKPNKNLLSNYVILILSGNIHSLATAKEPSGLCGSKCFVSVCTLTKFISALGKKG